MTSFNHHFRLKNRSYTHVRHACITPDPSPTNTQSTDRTNERTSERTSGRTHDYTHTRDIVYIHLLEFVAQQFNS